MIFKQYSEIKDVDIEILVESKIHIRRKSDSGEILKPKVNYEVTTAKTSKKIKNR